MNNREPRSIEELEAQVKTILTGHQSAFEEAARALDATVEEARPHKLRHRIETGIKVVEGKGADTVLMHATMSDGPKDTGRFLAGLQLLKDHGVAPHRVFVYMLVGYWPNESHADREERLGTIRAFGATPYPMPYRRTRELVGFQRWVIGGYDHAVPWAEWEAARYQPERLKRIDTGQQRLGYDD